MSLNEYKLSCELLGHSLDVRAVAEGPNSIISGSRDKKTKIWIADGNTYIEGSTLTDHTNFVSAICVLEDENWICTASNDSTVCIYVFGNLVPFVILRGHKASVCCLARGLEPQTLVTGSWDTTAQVWSISDCLPPTSIILKGHEAAVWAVTTLSYGRYATGSADKNIFIWNRKGEKVRVFKGHSDCVRGLIGLPNGNLISCGNDAVIKLWNEDGESVKELHGHSNYIYTIALNKFNGDDVFVTGSEDSTIRMWSLSKGQLGDALLLPAQSVWSVTCLKNGDIVTGSSDGVVRVLTKNPERFAPVEIVNAFTTAIETRKLEATKELGGMNVNELPGPESLLQDGTEGQTRIVRHPDGKILCYQWTTNKWNCLGDVMGATGGSQKTSGKVLHEGIEYDYVFNVDISDTDPAIKLPYNRGEDPWASAQKFIHKNNLPQAYLDQVAEFIVKNSDSAPIVPQNSGFVDPFTGESRYVPGTSNRHIAQDGVNLDPFTGDSSYSTQGGNENVNFTGRANGQNSYSTKNSSSPSKHFPINNYQILDNCDRTKILDKLRDFNNTKTGDGIYKVPDESLEGVIKLTNRGSIHDVGSISTLQRLLKWPEDILFPVLDVTRLVVCDESICNQLLPIEFMTLIIKYINSSPANQLMAIRCLTNMMNHKVGRELLQTSLLNIFEPMKLVKSGSVNLQIAIATFYLNLTIAQNEIPDANSCRLITEGIIDFMLWVVDYEASYRTIQAIGNLSCCPTGPINLMQIQSVDRVLRKIKNLSKEVLPDSYRKLSDCSQELCTLIL